MSIIQSLIRHALTAGGGALAARGYAVSGSDVETMAGAIAALVGVIWSVWSKRAKPETPSA